MRRLLLLSLKLPLPFSLSFLNDDMSSSSSWMGGASADMAASAATLASAPALLLRRPICAAAPANEPRRANDLSAPWVGSGRELDTPAGLERGVPFGAPPVDSFCIICRVRGVDDSVDASVLWRGRPGMSSGAVSSSRGRWPSDFAA